METSPPLNFTTVSTRMTSLVSLNLTTVSMQRTSPVSPSLPTTRAAESGHVVLEMVESDLAKCFVETFQNYGRTYPAKSIWSMHKLNGSSGTILASVHNTFSGKPDPEDDFLGVPKYRSLDLGDNCYVLITVPANHTMAITVLEMNETRSSPFALAVHDFRLSEERQELKWEFFTLSRTYRYISMSNTVLLRLTFVVFNFLARLQFQALALSGLEHHSTNQKSGFVQTPLFSSNKSLKLFYSEIVRPFSTITVPKGHVVLTSFGVRRIGGCVTLALRRDVGSRPDVTSTYCCRASPQAAVHDASSLTLQLSLPPNTFCKSNSDCCFYEHSVFTQLVTGFQLLYSFHLAQNAPQQLPSSRWNCSGSEWPYFRQHFQCDLVAQCRGREDEVDCPYTTSQCGPGAFLVARACFFVAKVPTGSSSRWVDGASTCAEEGGHMASLKTPERLKRVTEVLSSERTPADDFYVGLSTASASLPYWYATVYQWEEGTAEFHRFMLASSNTQEFYPRTDVRLCGCLEAKNNSFIILSDCSAAAADHVVCERPTKQATNAAVSFSPLAPNKWNSSRYAVCPHQHVTHTFLACDAKSACWWSQDGQQACAAPLAPFECQTGGEGVPYTLVCDSRPDCGDGSDEAFCVYPRCTFGTFSCGNGQCRPSDKYCDGWEDCWNGLDESKCSKATSVRLRHHFPPAMIDIVNDLGWFNFIAMNHTTGLACGETHFQCPENGYCLPVFLRCNGVPDCPFHEDEADCQNFTCPGFYRCRHSAVCLHPREVCDGRPHCPQHDDELLCGWDCPRGCLCYGWSFFCTQAVPLSGYSQLRYLDAHGSPITFADITNQPLLVFLNLSLCNFTSVGEVSYVYTNLRTLDLSYNLLMSVPAAIITHIPSLQVLKLTGNPLQNLLDGVTDQLPALKILDMHGIAMTEINISRVSEVFPHLHNINLSYSGLTHLMEEGFQPLQQLRVVDLRGCPVEQFSRAVFQRLVNLRLVYADSFVVCCPSLLPTDFNIRQCFAPKDELSSCEDLLGSALYTVAVFAFCLLGLAGNVVSFIYRSFFSTTKSRKGFAVLVVHLSLSDMTMGLYLAVIGCTDRVYRGQYLWNDYTWRHSSACYLAGFMSLLSSEVTTFVMCLITLDRFLVLRFPFSRLRFGRRSAHVAAALVWTTGLILASLPLMISHWRFYGQTAICIPLPIVKSDYPGRTYAFAVVIVLNFVLFLFVSMGQAVIYWSVQKNALSVNSSTKKTKDLTIARRLISVAMSNFLCWFPIGLLGLLTSRGLPVPREVSVGVAVLVLPLNSALNPFLYTLNVILERRQRAVQDRLMKLIAAQMKTQKSLLS